MNALTVFAALLLTAIVAVNHAGAESVCFDFSKMKDLTDMMDKYRGSCQETYDAMKADITNRPNRKAFAMCVRQQSGLTDSSNAVILDKAYTLIPQFAVPEVQDSILSGLKECEDKQSSWCEFAKCAYVKLHALCPDFKKKFCDDPPKGYLSVDTYCFKPMDPAAVDCSKEE